MAAELDKHLFPGDDDEHGAVIAASLVPTQRGIRLLGRRLYLAKDGVDYVAGERGYRLLTPSFVQDQIWACASSSLVYLAVHCHSGDSEVAFSATDLASHKRSYPALLDIADGLPVGALVFSRGAVAGDIWTRDGHRHGLDESLVVGPAARRFGSTRENVCKPDPSYDRQSRLFGDRGQGVLAAQKVGVIGAGGAGSLLIEYLARLGVGHLVVIDPDRMELSNNPRVVGSRRRDAQPLLAPVSRSGFLGKAGRRLATRKVAVARRVARQANPRIAFDGIAADVADAETAGALIDCDFIFLAADTMRARLVFNAIVQQYLIPGAELGAKVHVDRHGLVADVFSVVRSVLPGFGCMWCNGLIDPARLQQEATADTQIAQQRYVNDVAVRAPSVITLNAVAAAHAANEYMLSVTGLLPRDYEPCWYRFHPLARRSVERTICELPRRDTSCTECSKGGRLGAGDAIRLPTR